MDVGKITYSPDYNSSPSKLLQKGIHVVKLHEKNVGELHSSAGNIVSAASLHVPDEFAQKLLAEALTWLGTPYGKGQCVKQVRVDCGSFVDACFVAAGVETDGIPKKHIAGEVMLNLLEQSVLKFIERNELRPGDVIAFSDENHRYTDEPVHLAFVHEITKATTFIIEASFNGVVRHRLNNLWYSRIHSAWTFPR